MRSKKRQTNVAAEEKLRIVLRRLDEQPLRCFDVETSGLDWMKCHIVGFVLTFGPDPRDSYYLPFRHKPGGNIGGEPGPQDRHGWDRKTLHRGEKTLIAKLDQTATTNFGHNTNFDIKFMWEAGMQHHVSRFEDTQINAALIDEFQGRYSLEACANLAGVFAKKSREIEEHLIRQFPGDCIEGGREDKAPMAHYWRLAGDDPVAVEYAEGDGTSTWQLRDWQMQQIGDQQLTLVHDIESRLIPILARMTIRGIRVDTDRLDALIRNTDEQIGDLSKEFWDGFNPKSPLDVERYLTDKGVTDWQFSPGRKVRQPDGSTIRVPQKSFTEQWLLTQEHGKPIIRVRKLMTLRSSFLGPLRERHVRDDGRVHPSFNQLRSDEFGTVTGRLSCSDPNLQAVTKHDVDVGKLHRSVFIADEGRRFATRDYSQIEPRLLAMYTGSRVLWEGYTSDPPIDAHTSVSMQANRKWNDLTPAEQKAYRNNFGKRINQTVITGGGKGVLVGKYGVPANEVDQMLRDYHRVFPELRPFQKRTAATFRHFGYLCSLLGRRARLASFDLDYTGTNRLLQCGNADIIKLKMVEIGEWLETLGRPSEIDMLNNIHDDLCFQFKPGYGRELFDKAGEIMIRFGENEVIDLEGMPMVVDDGIGGDWAEATYSFEWEGGVPPYMKGKTDGSKKRRKQSAVKEGPGDLFARDKRGTLRETGYASKADKKRLDRERAGV